MGKYSLSFVIIVLILGLFIGSVGGSLVHQVLGFDFLDEPLFGSLLTVKDFYIIGELKLVITPAAILGLLATGYILYKKGN